MKKIALTKEFLQQALKELDQSGMSVLQLFPDHMIGEPIARLSQETYSSGSYPMCGYRTRMDEDRDYVYVWVYHSTKG